MKKEIIIQLHGSFEKSLGAKSEVSEKIGQLKLQTEVRT
jgi:hypothetical protein